MAKISREEVLRAALDLLNEKGIDALSTRTLAERLGVESPALYWYFRNKAELFSAMAEEITSSWHTLPVPKGPGDWRSWFAENARSFRRSLLAYRDGARLHAGTRPGEADLARLAPKIAYLMRAGFAQEHALMALYASGQYTLGCVLEEQARSAYGNAGIEPEQKTSGDLSKLRTAVTKSVRDGAEISFEFGLQLLIEGLSARQAKNDHSS